jgi:hypothetical protein
MQMAWAAATQSKEKGFPLPGEKCHKNCYNFALGWQILGIVFFVKNYVNFLKMKWESYTLKVVNHLNIWNHLKKLEMSSQSNQYYLLL